MNTLNMNWMPLAILTVATAGFSGTACADNPGFFVGASVGQSSIDESFDNGFSVDDEDTSYGVSAGYAFSDYFAVEGGYTDFGELKDSITVGGASGSVKAEVDGWNIGLVGTVPVAETFSLYGRLGWLFWDADATATVVGQPVVSDDDDGSDYYFGVGAEYHFTPQWSVTGGWDRYRLDDDDVDLDNLYVGVRYRF